MLLEEIKEKVVLLSPSDLLALMQVIITSLQEKKRIEGRDRSVAIKRMRGLLKTEQIAPNDQDIKEMLDQRRMEKYSA